MGKIVVVVGLPAATTSTASSKSGVTSKVGEIMLAVLIGLLVIGLTVVVKGLKGSVDGPKNNVLLYLNNI